MFNRNFTLVKLTFVLLIFLQIPLNGQSNWGRYPAINNDGTHITFSYQGDIWLYGLKDKKLNRLTVHESYDSHPSWNNDGTTIAFVSNRYGNEDIFTTTISGDKLEQKTFHNSDDTSPSWTPDNDILFNSRRTFVQIEREKAFYSLDSAQSTPSRMLDALGYEPRLSADGRYLAFAKGYCRETREAYKGPANRDIYIYDTSDSTYTQITKDEGQDIRPRWDDNGNLYFISARNGDYNIYKIIHKNGNWSSPQKITDESEEAIRWFSVSGDGETIVYEKGVELIYFQTNSGTKEQLKFSFPSDFHIYPSEYKSFKNKVSEFEVSPNSERIAIEVHGEIFVGRDKEDSEKYVNISKHPWNDGDPQWLNDSTLLFLSDRSGKQQLYRAKAELPDDSDLFEAYKFNIKKVETAAEYIDHYSLSNDNSKIAVFGDSILHTYTINGDAEINNQVKIFNNWASPSSINWSPDDQWIAYSQHDLNFNREVFIAASDGSKRPQNISLHPRSDYRPLWTPDGSKLAFISERNNGDNDLWFVWLKKEDWLKTQDDWEALKYKESEKEEEKDSTIVQIDFEDIEERSEQVTSFAGNESKAVAGKNGKTFYFTGPNGKETALYKISWDGSDLERIQDKVRFRAPRLSDDGKSIYYLSRGTVEKFDIKKKKSEKRNSSVKILIDEKTERRQVYNDVWKTLGKKFYDPQFHGENWDSLHREYQEKLIYASTYQDFKFLVNEMLGQINASHMGLYGSTPEKTQDRSTGKLGIEVSPDDKGVKVTHIVPRSPADREKQSLRNGDIITNVDGKQINSSVNFWSLFYETKGEKVWLEVLRDGQAQDVFIRPTSSLSNLLYEEWVKSKRALVDKYSDGKLGYIHIQGMNWQSFEEFERELMASGAGKKGLVIDVRFNGGGWTTDMLMTVLSVRQHAYTIPRGATDSLDNHPAFANYYPYGERLPLSAYTGPAVTLCNEFSYSNAEIFSHAFKNLDRGPLVGFPTFGAVISTGGKRLLDGSFVRIPFRAWYVKKTGKNMEGTPAVPDFVLDNPVDIDRRTVDPQLKKAVEVMLDRIEK